MHLGDLVDRRQYINFNTLQYLKDHIIDKLQNYDVHIIAGNHDVFYKSTNRVNALQLLVSDKCNVYIDPTEIQIDETSILLLPWINSENFACSMEAIEQSKSSLCFGHLEISGFEMFKGALCDHGLSHSLFDKFDMVLSGHFHHKSNRTNVYYLGAPYQMTWSDYGFERGFHVLDLNTRELEFIPNPNSMFVKFNYDDTQYTFEQMNELVQTLKLDGKICKIDIIQKQNPYTFDLIVDKIQSFMPFDVKINTFVPTIETHNDDNDYKVEDTQSLIFKAIDQIETHHDKNSLKQMMGDLYVRALDIQINS